MKEFVSKKKLVGAATVTVIVALVLSIGVSVYSAPGNKLSRQLDLGYRYLENGQYEEAILSFENAISIDEKCMEAYTGGIEAYLMTDDREALLAFYDRALSTARNLDEGFLKINEEFVEKIYLSAERVYSDDPENKLNILEEGWDVTGSTKIKEELIEGYLDAAEKKTAEGEYEEELEALDKLLELAKDDEKVLKTIEMYLNEYIGRLLEEGRYDDVRKLAGKYGELVDGIDFDGILREIETIELAGQDGQEDALTEGIEEEEGMQGEDSLEQEEDESETGESENKSVDALQSDDWVEELYQKIIAEDVDAVFAIMEQPDFIEKCEKFPHEFIAWSTDYNLSTSDGKVLWVIKGSDSDFLSVVYYPDGDNYGNWNVGAPPSGWGDYVFEFDHDGGKQWLIRYVAHMSDGRTLEVPQDAIWTVYHM